MGWYEYQEQFLNEELKLKIAELEKEMAAPKTELAAMKSENGVMRDVLAVWKNEVVGCLNCD